MRLSLIMMACVVVLSTIQVMAFGEFEDRNRKFKIVMSNHEHEEVKDKLKKRFKKAEKLED